MRLGKGSSIASQRTRPNDEYKSIAVPMRVLSPPHRTDIQGPVSYTNTTRPLLRTLLELRLHPQPCLWDSAATATSFHIPSRTHSSQVAMASTSPAHTIRTRIPSCSSTRSSAATSRPSHSASPTTIRALWKSVNRPVPLGAQVYGLLRSQILGHVGKELAVRSYVLTPSSQ